MPDSFCFVFMLSDAKIRCHEFEFHIIYGDSNQLLVLVSAEGFLSVVVRYILLLLVVKVHFIFHSMN